MSDYYQTIRSQYEMHLKEFEKRKDIDDEEKSEYIEKLQKKLTRLIKDSDELTDEEKMSFLDEVNDNRLKNEIIVTLKSDDLKLKKVSEINDRYDKREIVLSIKDDETKVKNIDLLEDDDFKLELLSTVKEDKAKDYLDTKPELKEKMVFYISNQMKKSRVVKDENGKTKLDDNIDKTAWKKMKDLGLERRVISHLLSDTKLKAIDKMDDDMKKDVEEYLGSKIPEERSDISKIESLNIDLDTLNEGVITNKEQLQMDDLEKAYYGSIRTDEKSEKIIQMKDFVGTESLNTKAGIDRDKVETWKDYIDSLKRIDHLANNDKSLFLEANHDTDKIRLLGVEGKYVVSVNGNHRMSILKAKYLTEIKRANGDPEKLKDIEEEFQIKVGEATDLPKDKEEMVAVILISKIAEMKDKDIKILEAVEEGKKVGYRIQDKEEIVIKSKEELLSYLEKSMSELSKEEKETLNKDFIKMNMKEENKDILYEKLDPEKYKAGKLLETIKKSGIRELNGKIKDIKEYQETIKELDIEEFGEEEKRLKIELEKSIESFEQKIYDAKSLEEAQEIMTTMEKMGELDGLVDGINSNMETKYQEALDKKVQELIKGAKIDDLEIKSELLKESKLRINFFEKIFGKQKLIDEKIEALSLQKQKIELEEIETIPDENRSIEGLIQYCNENGTNTKISDFLKKYATICKDDSLKEKINETLNKTNESEKSKEYALVLQEKTPLFQINKQTKKLREENEEQRKENNSINNSNRNKEKFTKGIKIEENPEIKKGKELARMLEEMSKEKQQKTNVQENER